MTDPLRAEITDANDPRGLGRVKVSYWATGATPDVWAQVLRPDPAVPPTAYAVGDIVLVVLEGGDPDLPVVIGALSSRS